MNRPTHQSVGISFLHLEPISSRWPQPKRLNPEHQHLAPVERVRTARKDAPMSVQIVSENATLTRDGEAPRREAKPRAMAAIRAISPPILTRRRGGCILSSQ